MKLNELSVGQPATTTRKIEASASFWFMSFSTVMFGLVSISTQLADASSSKHLIRTGTNFEKLLTAAKN